MSSWQQDRIVGRGSHRIGRRSALALGAGLTLVGAMGRPSAGAAAPTSQQVPGVYRTRIGEAEVTVLLDGFIDVTPPYWANLPVDMLKAGLKEAFLPADKPLRISINAYVVNVGGRLVAIDAGADTFFGPSGGRYLANLAAAGINPEDVGTVLLTHLHPDHIGGLVAGGRAAFPNAQVFASAPDHAYWTSGTEQARAPGFAKSWFDAVALMTRLYGDRLHLFRGEAEPVPGFHAVALPGHTPGHSGYVFASGEQRIFFWADTTASTALQLNRPERTLVFDVDQQMGKRSRMKAVALASGERLLVAGSHVPFPGLGHVAKDARGYRFEPAQWDFLA